MSDIVDLGNLVTVPVPPTPVVNVSAGHTDRQVALLSAVLYHQILGTESEEAVIETAQVYEFYLEHGEYPQP